MVGDPSGVETVPVVVASLTAYPNPFNPQVSIALTLDHETSAVLSVFDLAGRRVQTLASGVFEAGERTYSWNGRDESGRSLSSGVYLVRLHGEDVDLFHKIVLMQ